MVRRHAPKNRSEKRSPAWPKHPSRRHPPAIRFATIRIRSPSVRAGRCCCRPEKITEHDRRKNMDAKTDESAGKCPFTGGTRGPGNRGWWPEQLDLQVLHRNSDLSDPMGAAFDYAKEFKTLDL